MNKFHFLRCDYFRCLNEHQLRAVNCGIPVTKHFVNIEAEQREREGGGFSSGIIAKRMSNLKLYCNNQE